MAKKCKMPVLITAEEIKRYKRENSMPCFEHKTCDTCKFYCEEDQQEEKYTFTF